MLMKFIWICEGLYSKNQNNVRRKKQSQGTECRLKDDGKVAAERVGVHHWENQGVKPSLDKNLHSVVCVDWLVSEEALRMALYLV